jgi:TolB-like protein/Tfp pilus assembly protein PilF
LAVGYWWKAKQANAQGIRSIAVLPFKLLGAGENDKYLTMGFADVLITRLGSLNRIVLRPTSAVFKYTDAEQDALAAGKELKVDAVLEGSIQKAGGRLRVTARLLRVRDGESMWAETFNGRLADPFAVQDEMSERLAVALALNPAEDEKRLLTRRYTESIEAYQAYARGRYLWNKRDPGSFKKAIEYFEEAIKIDGDYALAYAGLADCYSLLVSYLMIPQNDGFPKARVAAQRALEIDDTLTEAHTSLAKILQLYDWNWEEAEKEFRRAIELNPNYATAHQWYGEYLISMGRFDEAEAEMKLALELDPVSPAINVAQGFPYYYNRKYDEAIAAYKKAFDLDPTSDLTHARLFAAYCQKRMYDEAIAEYVAVYVNYPQFQERVKTAYAASGITGFWEMHLPSSQREKQKWQIARVYANLNNKVEALMWLEKAVDGREHNMTLLKVDPEFDSLRSEPRFQELLKRMRLAP